MEALTPAQVQALLNVNAQSLARHCGLVDDPSNSDVRSEEQRLVILSRQLGLMQRWPRHEAEVVYNEFSAKYLSPLVVQYKQHTTAHNTAMKMLNVVSHTPYFARYQKTPPALGLVVVQATRMADEMDDSSDSEIIAEVIAEVCQFFSTLLVLQGATAIPEDVKTKLITKLGKWRRLYQGRFSGETSDRCYQLLQGTREMTVMSRMMKETLERSLNQCGFEGCDRRVGSVGPELKQCSRCKCAVYCGATHQKQHWPEHKKSCYVAAF